MSRWSFIVAVVRVVLDVVHAACICDGALSTALLAVLLTFWLDWLEGLIRPCQSSRLSDVVEYLLKVWVCLQEAGLVLNFWTCCFVILKNGLYMLSFIIWWCDMGVVFVPWCRHRGRTASAPPWHIIELILGSMALNSRRTVFQWRDSDKPTEVGVLSTTARCFTF